MLEYFFPFIVPWCMDAYQSNTVFFVSLPYTEKILTTAMKTVSYKYLNFVTLFMVTIETMLVCFTRRMMFQEC